MSASEQTSASKRKPGYYHIVFEGREIVAWWNSHDWFLPARTRIFKDDEFTEIDERRIERQEPDELELAVNSPSFVNPQLEDEVFSRQPDELSKAQEREDLLKEVVMLIDGCERNAHFLDGAYWPEQLVSFSGKVKALLNL